MSSDEGVREILFLFYFVAIRTLNIVVMKTLAEVEKRKQCELNFASIQSLEAQIPDEECQPVDEWIRDNIDREYWPVCFCSQGIENKYK